MSVAQLRSFLANNPGDEHRAASALGIPQSQVDIFLPQLKTTTPLSGLMKPGGVSGSVPGTVATIPGMSGGLDPYSGISRAVSPSLLASPPASSPAPAPPISPPPSTQLPAGRSFQAVDPGRSFGPDEALGLLQSLIGRALSDGERQEAISIAQRAGWSGGSAPLRGDILNVLIQEAVQRTPGGQFTPWKTPSGGPPPSGPAPPPTSPPKPGGVPIDPGGTGIPINPGGHLNPPGGGSPGGPINTTISDPPAFVAPKFGPAARLTLPDAYTGSAAFRAPTSEEAATDPGYQFRLKRGLQALENNAAARRAIGSTNTLQDFMHLGQEMASQEYDKVYGRRFGEYNMSDAIGRDVNDRAYRDALAGYGADREGRLDTYNAAFEGQQAEYQPRFAGWEARTNIGQRNAELNFDRDWQREVYGRDENRLYDFYNSDDRRLRDFYNADDTRNRDFWEGDDRRLREFWTGDDRWRRDYLDEQRRWQILNAGQ